MTIKLSSFGAANTQIFRGPADSSQQSHSDHVQHTDVKVQKTIFVGNDTSQILWLGKSRGRCISMWRRDPESEQEPYKILSTKNIDVDPNDVCLLSNQTVCVGFADGSLAILNTDVDDIVLTQRIAPVHNGCASRFVCRYENSVLSASTNGSLELVDVETGKSSTVCSGQSGIRSMCTTFGGQLVATGNTTGQVAVWDLRENNEGGKLNTLKTMVPSTEALDAVTALCSHPAQSNLICCGTESGILGLVDARNGQNATIASTYEVAARGITQVMFHPTCSDNLLCSSNDGSLLRLDASGAPIQNQIRAVKDNVWLNGELAKSLRVEPIQQGSIFPITSFDCRGDTIVASSTVGLITAFEDLSFFPSSASGFGRF